MTRVIVIANQKGGVGKTTTAVNVAHGLALRGHQTLLIDLDSQGSAGLSLGIDPTPATYRLILSKEPLPELVARVRENLDLLTSDESLADVRDWLAVKSARDANSALRALTSGLDGHMENYEFVIIDCGPGLDILTLNALIAGTDVMVPVSVDFLSAAGTRQHLDTLEGLREVGGKARLHWVVPTYFDGRLIRAREIMALLENAFGELLTEPIRRNTRLAEAPHSGETIFEYDPKALGAEDYGKLVERVIHDTQETG